MSDEIKVDSGVPFPTTRRNRKYPWHKMKKGDSFFAAVPYMQGQAFNAAQKIGNGCKFMCRSVTEKGVKGTRVWRVS